MVISASGRTDIPAYYADWFYNRAKAGFACVRNPYYPEQVARYRLDPGVVDAVFFCTKNPAPMLGRISGISRLRPYFFVTITPYGRDIEPNVPPVHDVASSLVELSKRLGPRSVSWRYDPIFLDETYTMNRHVSAFDGICRVLEGSVTECVISFLQRYGKTERNFPGVRDVSPGERRELLSLLVPLARARGITIRTCADYAGTAIPGLSDSGCVTRTVLLRHACIDAPAMHGGPKREGCKCDLPTRDIGAYNSCPHGCKYCYANYDMNLAMKNYRAHDPASELLVGGLTDRDTVTDARQDSYRQEQLSFDIFE
jgi:hypothetical protein